MRISLIVSTYNKSDYLDLVLASVAWQIETPWEVIVADDGSSVETTSVISRWRNRSIFKLIHMFQPDDGFRLSRSRNLAASKASGSWVVFLDGDCVMPPEFIATQARLAEASCVVFGSRKLLSETQATGLLRTAPTLTAISPYLSGRKFWKIPFGVFRKFPQRSWRQARGFHLALDMRLFRSLGGFDESYRSWGLEDSDFLVRASRLGVTLKDGRYATSLLHLYHPEPSKSEISDNQARFDNVLNSNSTCPRRSLFLGSHQYVS